MTAIAMYNIGPPVSNAPKFSATTNATSNHNTTNDINNTTTPLNSSNTNRVEKEETTTATTTTTTTKHPSGSSSSQPQDENGDKKKSENGTTPSEKNGSANNTDGATSTPAPNPPPPLLKGTLSYNLESKRHVMRGMWNYENSHEFPPQRFELVRNLSPSEDPKILPKDGEFHGSFSLAYYHTTSKGKRKERSRVIPESGVKITFTKKSEESDTFDVKGQGTNQFGVFNIMGTASRSKHEGDPSFTVELRKKYVSSPAPPSESGKKIKKSKSLKRKHNHEVEDQSQMEEGSGPLELPPPSPVYPSNVVCLRGKLSREKEDELGVPQVVHKIKGMWSSGLDLLLADPSNAKGLCNAFDYEHRCTVPTDVFPISGRYTGWFLLSNDDGTRTRVTERDVFLKFRKNNEGYYNVEGRGSNGFGKYSITGTLGTDDILTIFRHFQPRKPSKTPKLGSGKTPSSSSVSEPKVLVNGGQKKVEEPPGPPPLTLDDVVISDEGKDQLVLPIPPPAHGTYSAVSRGVLRINSDGAHTCSGKWAMTREHYTNGHTSNFHFGLEAHHAAMAAKAMLDAKKKSEGEEDEEGEVKESDTKPINPADALGSLSTGPPSLSLNTFPVDSAQYKGSFKMRRGTTKYTSIIDRQVVLKFRKNSAGSFNVHGKGVNSIGTFFLMGTLIPSSKGSGQVELYRTYPLVPPPPSKETEQSNTGAAAATTAPTPLPTPTPAPAPAPAPTPIPTPPPGSIGGGKHLATPPPPIPKKIPIAGSVEAKPGHIPKLPKPKIAEAALEDDELSEGEEIETPKSQPETPLPPPPEPNSPTPGSSMYLAPTLPTKTNSILPTKPTPLPSGIQRSSSRQSKLPPHLSEDDPKALQARIMDKCGQILRSIREKDLASGSFFAEPVDPVALGIPTYHQIISNPMDLGTIQQKLNAGEVESHIEFARLVRLVFENAMTFNIDSTHAVHIGARNLLNLFNQKFKDVEKDEEKLTEIKKPKKSSKAEREQKKKEKEAAKEAKRKAKEERLERKKKAKAEREADEGKKKVKKAKIKDDDKVLEGYVAKAEFDALKSQMQQMRGMLEMFQKQLANNGVKVELPLDMLSVKPQPEPEPEPEVEPEPVTPAKSTETTPSKKSKKKPPKKEPPPEEEKPLTLKEQEILTDTINRISADKLPGVIQIIRESTKLSGDEEEIDLEIDQLDTATQRKLQRFVMKNVKPRRPKPKPSAKKSKPTPAPAPAPSASPPPPPKKPDPPAPTPPQPKKTPKPKPKPNRDSFMPFNDSSSDSDDSSTSSEEDDKKQDSKPQPKKDSFHLGDEDEDADAFGDASVLDDEDDDDLGNENLASKWDMSNITQNNEEEDDSDSDNDKDMWGAARQQAAASKALEAERKKREEKTRIEAERAKQQRLEEAAALGEQLREQRREKEEEEERLRQKQKQKLEEERKAAREALRQQTASVRQEVDMDAQRDLMSQIEKGLMDVDGGASPSSDFGF